MSTLTPREREVVALVTEGLSNKEIAARLGTSESTVRKQVSAALHKAGAPSRTALAVEAVRAGA